MCGIVGQWNTRGAPVDRALLERMRDAMTHRGPDGAGLWISPDGSIGLGHRRLSIIDLSASAAQPMPNEDGTIQVVFNGEIYNHAEIRAELQRIGGHVWRTDHSDTEVIIHAYEQWGIDFIHRIRGMFAIAIWDGRARKLHLVRDRLGIKPLYWTQRDGTFVFASEIKALLEDPAQPRRLDEEAFAHYLAFLASPAPRTLFRGINKLPSATMLCVSAGGIISEQRWWDPFDAAAKRQESKPAELSAELLALLREAVGLRKVSDVPVGVFLSGGVDSSTNALLFSEAESGPVRTFSIGYDGDYPSARNELDHAAAVAKKIGAQHHEYRITQNDVLDYLPRMIASQDEPIADPVCVPVHFVAKLARDNGVKVCQVGEGADELFCGYPGWLQLLNLQSRANLPLPSFAFRAAQHAMTLRAGPDSMAAEWLRRAADGRPVFWGGAECMTMRGRNTLLAPPLRARLASLDPWSAIEPVRRRFEEKAWEKHPLQWMTYLDLNHRLPELLHMRLDKMTMGVGLEAREPFLDHRLVEFAFSLPASVKLGAPGSLKPLLKSAVRGLVPDAVLDRPKQGFALPVNEWLHDRLGRQIEADLHAFARETEIFDPHEIARVLRERRRGMVWNLMNFARWWKTYRLS